MTVARIGYFFHGAVKTKIWLMYCAQDNMSPYPCDFKIKRDVQEYYNFIYTMLESMFNTRRQSPMEFFGEITEGAEIIL